MGLDISKITNEQLKKLAFIQDADNNGKLSAQEFTIFKQEAAKIDCSPEDFNQAMGLYTTNPVTPTEATKVEEKPVEKNTEISRKEKREINKQILDVIKEYIDGGYEDGMYSKYSSIPTRQGLIHYLSEQFKGNEKAIAAFQELVPYLPITGNLGSKKEVNAARIKAVNNYSLTESQIKIVNEFGKVVKNEQINNELEEMREVFNELKNDPENKKVLWTKNQNGEDVLNLDACKKLLRKSVKHTSYFNEAFKAFKDDLRGYAVSIHDYKVTESEGQTKREVKKEALKEVGKNDTLSRQTIRKQEDTHRIVANTNYYFDNKEQLKTVTNEDLEKNLTKDMLSKLYRSYLDKDQQQHDLTRLGEIFENRVGFDLTIDRSGQGNAAELANVKADMHEETGIWFDDKELLKLAKLCKVRDDGKDRSWKAITEGTPFAALGSAISALATSPVIRVTQTVPITVDANLKDEILKNLSNSGITPDVTDLKNGSFLINIKQEVLLYGGGIAALAGAGIGVVTTLVLNAIFGKERAAETACIAPNDRSFATIDEYSDYIKARYPKVKADILIELAKFYVKDGKFDWNGFEDHIKKIGGPGSVMSCDELKAAALYTPKAVSPQETVKPTIKLEKPEALKTLDSINITREQPRTMEYIRRGGDTWSGLIYTYYPEVLDNHSLKAAIKELKRLWNVDPLATDLPGDKPTFPAELLGTKLQITIEEDKRNFGFDKKNLAGKDEYKEATSNYKVQLGDNNYTATVNSSGNQHKDKAKDVAVNNALEETDADIVRIKHEDGRIEIRKKEEK